MSETLGIKVFCPLSEYPTKEERDTNTKKILLGYCEKLLARGFISFDILASKEEKIIEKFKVKNDQ